MKKVKKQFCKHGHDLTVVGVNKRGVCKKCVRLSDIKYRSTEHGRAVVRKCQKEWENSPKGKKSIKRYRTSSRGKQIHRDGNKKYDQTEKGKAATKRANQKRKEYKLEHQRKWREKHRELVNQTAREWRAKHPEVQKLLNLKNHSERKLRIPKFGQENILIIYAKCPTTKEVDHFIPLQGELVSGLHVDWNLRYLTPRQNRLKNNKTDILEISEWYGELLRQEGLK